MYVELISSGLDALREYLSAHVLTCLVPAFFIAGGIAAFVSQTSVIKYFGPKANKFLAYGTASVSGAILAVCSCTILPLFAGIRQRGAGLGPAAAFLYSGPAINVLAIVYSARLLGIDLGIARAVGAVVFSVVVGLIMAAVFKREEEALQNRSEDFILAEDEKKQPLWKIAVFFAVMTALLISAASIGLRLDFHPAGSGEGIVEFAGKIIPAALSMFSLAAVIWLSAVWYNRGERVEWMAETWKLTRKIFPLLLAGVFLAGMVKALLPEAAVQRWVGGNSFASNLLASVFGALMYFSTLTEVPIVKALMDLGMGKGPALTLLLAGPSLSLPNMIVIGRVMGVRRTAVYTAAVIVMATMTGWMFGKIA